MDFRSFMFILLGSLLLFLTGCQGYSKVEYFESGQIKSVEKNDGFIDWSGGKTFSFSAIGG